MNSIKNNSSQKIPAKYKFLLNSKWTSLERFLDWKHFLVIDVNYEIQPAKALIQSICDPSVSAWIEADSLKDQSKWQAGWKRISISDQKI